MSLLEETHMPIIAMYMGIDIAGVVFGFIGYTKKSMKQYLRTGIFDGRYLPYNLFNWCLGGKIHFSHEPSNSQFSVIALKNGDRREVKIIISYWFMNSYHVRTKMVKIFPRSSGLIEFGCSDEMREG